MAVASRDPDELGGAVQGVKNEGAALLPSCMREGPGVGLSTQLALTHP